MKIETRAFENFMILNTSLLEMLREESRKSVRYGSNTDRINDMLLANDDLRIEMQALKGNYESCMSEIEHSNDIKNAVLPYVHNMKQESEYDNMPKEELLRQVKALHSIAYVAIDWGDYMKEEKSKRLIELFKEIN